MIASSSSIWPYNASGPITCTINTTLNTIKTLVGTSYYLFSEPKHRRPFCVFFLVYECVLCVCVCNMCVYHVYHVCACACVVVLWCMCGPYRHTRTHARSPTHRYLSLEALINPFGVFYLVYLVPDPVCVLVKVTVSESSGWVSGLKEVKQRLRMCGCGWVDGWLWITEPSLVQIRQR